MATGEEMAAKEGDGLNEGVPTRWRVEGERVIDGSRGGGGMGGRKAEKWEERFLGSRGDELELLGRLALSELSSESSCSDVVRFEEATCRCE
jgi:hypothetical protein